MSNEKVAYSRQGDDFHYRWAARRCLKLIHPNSSLQTVVIEGSNEEEKEGEYVIDFTEYYEFADNKRQVKYYQLKHTTVQKDDPFVLSDLKDTIKGFSKRFLQHNNGDTKTIDLSFIIVSNRPIKESFKQNIYSLADGMRVDNNFKKTIEEYTSLSSIKLSQFCKLIIFQDSEGDYNVQKDELRFEIAQLIAGSVDNAQIENIVSLIRDKVTELKNKSINREDLLKRFGLSSEKELFPAPPIWEQAKNFIEREQHEWLKSEILSSSYPVIVHAPGGVGKSVFCRQLIDSLPSDSIGIAYDCFGAGRYRNTSEPRHRHRDALVQIVNELAVKGLCDPLLVQDTSHESNIMKKFLMRLDVSVKALKQTSDTATLLILVDAADNAEMAAKEFSHLCFASDLLREDMPNGCKLVLLCRTERISYLKPNSKIVQLKLDEFTEAESLLNLRNWFPDANETDGLEFHRLTSKNPRVQANALSLNATSITELLESLGPGGMTVDKQIEFQLNTAVSKIKDSLPDTSHLQIQAICLGLASLPPHIPIEILAIAAGVTLETIKSFVADIGRSLWLSDESVQFIDEPTETWFRETYLAVKEDFERYLAILEPLSGKHVYVAEVLPNLYLQAEKYEKLIEIALSDYYLPEDNPIDARNVLVYRLQFSFRAALRAKRYDDAIKIAIRSGEEMAGNQRQLGLFQNNIDLLVSLQDKQKIQEIAFKRLLRGKWNGSENVYTASLLSGINEYKGEARGYLRAGLNWLQIYFDELQQSEDRNSQNEVSKRDIVEISFTIFNIYGVGDCIDFLNRFKSKVFVFGIMQDITRRLIDKGNFDAIDSFLKHCIKQPYYIVAITSELLKVGRFPEVGLIEPSLNKLLNPKNRIKIPLYFGSDDKITPSIISFIEVCLSKNVSPEKLVKVLDFYIPERASQAVSSTHQSHERAVYLKALAIRMLLDGKSNVDIDAILPDTLVEKKRNRNYEHDRDVKDFCEVINGLFPWFFLRLRILSNREINFEEEIKIVTEQSRKARYGRYGQYDTLPNEIAAIQSSILILYNKGNKDQENWFYNTVIKNNKSLWVRDQIQAVRAAYKLSHLESIKHDLEQTTFERIKNINDDGPDEAAERYIDLARAVLNSAPEDSVEYFEEAVNIVSKFGDEIVRRWEAVVSLAKHSCNCNNIPDELAYRFIRCAEVVGENVSREKYWNRSEAIAVCTRMSSGIGISALSRWRDRHIGRFKYQLEALISELVQTGKISSSTGWAFSRFLSNQHLKKFLTICLENEKAMETKQRLFSDAVHLLQTEGTSAEFWEEMRQIASVQNIQNDTLKGILDFYQKNNSLTPETKKASSIINSVSIIDKLNWKDVFGNLNIMTVEGFEKCLKSFNTASKKQPYRSIESFWHETIHKLAERDIWKFVEILLLSEIGIFEIKSFFNSLPKDWKSKISFKKRWPNLVKQLGQKYALKLVNQSYIDYFIRDFALNSKEIERLKEGIFEGLASGYEFSSAEMFFEFVSLAIPTIKPEEARDLLDFALSRFELHIDEDFGDGKWLDWLTVPSNINKSIAGFIWSALGSPRSEDRWDAAHTVRMLAELNCIELVDELNNWMQHDKVDALGSIKFPFYNLHARLYLFIAFARVSLNKPELLISYKDLFIKHAFGEPHILNQKYAVEIAINLSKFSVNIYNDETLDKLKTFGKSKMPIIEMNYNDRVDSYWHINDEVETEYDFHFAYDFDQYWFEPLSNVFGLPNKQVEDIAAHTILKEWGINTKSGYDNDARVSIWNSFSNGRETWHDHGSYPRTDNLDFYLSYHSMMVTAAKLIEKMPVVSKHDWDEDTWENWLERHLLTCDNGKWLSDYRDPVPLKRPPWISENRGDNWRTDISEESFTDALLLDVNGELWINVIGGWEETKSERIENYSVASALVSKCNSDALLRAFETCSDPYDYGLPFYNEDDMEIELDSFMLKGWIENNSVSIRLDEYDPYADNIDYPPYVLGSEIISKLKLTATNDLKIWHCPISTSPSLKCEIWSSFRADKDEYPDQSGKRLKASLEFLKYLCSTLDCELIIDVGIKRDIIYKYQSRENEYEYIKPKHKIFILSSDGTIRSTGKIIKLG
ncbi:MAG: hypothetical protein ACWA6U_17095 [Breznakibacter sp.]